VQITKFGRAVTADESNPPNNPLDAGSLMLQRQEAIHGFLPTVTFFQPQSGPDLAQMASCQGLGVTDAPPGPPLRIQRWAALRTKSLSFTIA
jgi:hypothetical protein